MIWGAIQRQFLGINLGLYLDRYVYAVARRDMRRACPAEWLPRGSRDVDVYRRSSRTPDGGGPAAATAPTAMSLLVRAGRRPERPGGLFYLLWGVEAAH